MNGGIDTLLYGPGGTDIECLIRRDHEFHKANNPRCSAIPA